MGRIARPERRVEERGDAGTWCGGLLSRAGMGGVGPAETCVIVYAHAMR